MARKKKTIKAKEPVKLRAKKLANGNQSLYLETHHGLAVFRPRHSEHIGKFKDVAYGLDGAVCQQEKGERPK